MQLIFILILSTLTAQASTKKEIDEAKKSIRAIIQPLLALQQKKTSQIDRIFRVDNCEKYNIDWVNILLKKSEMALHYNFKDGCDIEGVLRPDVFRPFAMTFNLRHLGAYTKIEGQNKITVSIESKPIVNLEIRSGVLTGSKGKVYFEADYRVQINPASSENLVEKNLGGELRISEVFGEKVSIKEKISIAR